MENLNEKVAANRDGKIESKEDTHINCSLRTDDLISLVQKNDLEKIQNLLREGISEQLLNARNHEGRTALHEACQTGNTDLVAIFLAENADTNLQDAFLQTPLILASEGSHTAIVELLCQSKANKNVQDSFGRSALHWAGRQCNLPSMAALLEPIPSIEGGTVDPNLKTTSGETPLHWLCALPPATPNQVECVRMILESGADPRLKNNNGDLATDLVDSSEIKSMLEEKAPSIAKEQSEKKPSQSDTPAKKEQEMQSGQSRTMFRSSAGPKKGFSQPKKKQPKLKITLKK
mmetsp:Transcript_27756/g.34721  ORF Transcript_27756/g.34721 Transcript_27756/m.34721 type:complete len:290 (+) Transcript_27756:23-892(+)